jgi:phosphopantetheine--protein transferase-like protein
MKKVIGCGIDIEEFNRFTSKIPARHNITAFAEMVYTADEINNNLNTDPALSFPLGFSCKEAFFKALGVSWTNSDISWKDIELLFMNKNNLYDYTIRLSGHAKKLSDRIRCRNIRSSFEFTEDYLIFQIVLLS